MGVSELFGGRFACAKPLNSPLSPSSAVHRYRVCAAILVAALFIPLMTIRSGQAATFELPGSFGVNPVGAATYSIPIDVPPGTAGMVPSLSLNYNSQGGDGLTGVGWSIGGLSQIERCPQTIAQDGVGSAVNNDGNDRLCLNGQRLMVVSGTYGANNAVYRLEKDNFTVVTETGSLTGAGTGTYFTAKDRSGRTYEYGNISGSNPYNSEVVSPATGVGLIWALDKATDTAGNYYTVAYYQGANVGIAPLTINYTGNGTALSPYNTVTFLYGGGVAGTVRMRHQGGVRFVSPMLLKSIYADTGTGSGTTTVSHYTLGYQVSPVTTRAELKSVTKCDGGASPVCLPATTFAWPAASGVGTFGGPTGTQTGFCPSGNISYGDFDGDGLTDMVCLGGGGTNQVLVAFASATTPGTFTAASAGWQSVCTTGSVILVGDFDGDGKTDLVCNNTDNTHRVLLSNGDGTFRTKPATAMWCDSNADVSVGDFNGDGRSDLICNGADKTHAVALSNGDGSFVFEHPAFSGAAWCNPSNLRTGDFNGDGKLDLICLASVGANANQQIVAFSNGDGSFTQAAAGWQPATGTFCDSPSDIGFGDFDGDGKTDLVCNMANGSHQVAFAQGDGTFDQLVSMSAGWCSSPGVVTYGDFNGDGRTDLACVETSGNIWVALSQGYSGFNTLALSMTNWCPFTAGSQPTLGVGDFNGDGRSDLICPSATASHYLIGLSGGAPDTISSFTTGLGATASVSYAPLTVGGIAYLKGQGTGYPALSSPGSLYTISSTAKSNGIGGVYVQSYSYGAPQTDLTGRGFQGFRFLAVNDFTFNVLSTNTQSYTYYNQNWPLTGTVEVQKLFDYPGGYTSGATGNLIRQSNNTYINPPTTSRTYSPQFVGLSQTVLTGIELNGTDPLPTITISYGYDSYVAGSPPYTGYGNVVQVTVSSNEGYQSVTCNTYANDTSDWVLGELTKTKTTGAIWGGSNSCASLPTAVRTTTYSYSPSSGTPIPGFVYSKTVEPASSIDLVNTAFTPDAFGNITSATVTGSNFASRTTSIAYDSYGRFPTAKTNALNQTTSVTYDLNYGGITSSTDPNNVVTTWTYDTLGRKASQKITSSDGTSLPKTNWSYSSASGCSLPSSGCYVQVTQTGHPTVTTFYDILERPGFTSTPTFGGADSAISNLTEYDALGHVLAAVRPYVGSASTTYPTTYTYDDIGRVATASRPDGGVTTFAHRTYAYAQITEAAVSGPGITTYTPQFVENSLGQTVESIDANNNNTLYSYDAFGDLQTVTDPNSNVVTMNYDYRGHMVNKHDPDKGTWVYTYDGLGEALTQTDAMSSTITFTYDLLGRPITENGAVTPHSRWAYDTQTNGVGKLATATTIGSTNYRTESYDTFGRSTSTVTTIDGTSYTTSTVYDSYGRLGSKIYASGETVDYNYNAWQHLSSLTHHSNGAAIWTADSEDAAFNVTKETYGNGVVNTQTFSPQNGLITSIDAVSGSTSVRNLTYAWDVAGNLTTRSDTPNANEFFTYDLLNRVTGVTFTAWSSAPAQTYSYDAIGNITSKSDIGTYTYGAGAAGPHAVTSITGTIDNGAASVTNPTYTYDANGRLIGGTNGRSYTYAGFDAPVTVTNPTGTVTFTVDAEHRRIKQAAPEGTTLYISAQGVRTELFTPMSGPASWRSYVTVGSRIVDILQGVVTYTPTNTYVLTDHLGSTIALTNGAGGIVENDAYDVWGKRRNLNGMGDFYNAITSATTRGYTGQEHLSDSGLIHMNARLYDPQVGKFLSGDPMDGSPAGRGDWNRYAYAGGNPLNRIDPTGMDDAPPADDSGDSNAGGFTGWLSQELASLSTLETINVYGPCPGDCYDPATTQLPAPSVAPLPPGYVGIVITAPAKSQSNQGQQVSGPTDAAGNLVNKNGEPIDDEIVVTGSSHPQPDPSGFIPVYDAGPQGGPPGGYEPPSQACEAGLDICWGHARSPAAHDSCADQAEQCYDAIQNRRPGEGLFLVFGDNTVVWVHTNGQTSIIPLGHPFQ